MINKIYLITKRIIQIILYLVEVIGISFLLTCVSNKFFPTSNIYDFLERITIFYMFYQIIIYGVLQQLNDIKKDEYLAVLNMFKYIKIFINDEKDYLLNVINGLLDGQLDSSVLNDNLIRNEYLEIKNVLDNNMKFDRTLIDVKILYYEHLYEAESLNWKYSLFIRIFK
ncbi:MAG: hypothetical protein RR359_05590 [Bacilli bacterium]